VGQVTPLGTSHHESGPGKRDKTSSLLFRDRLAPNPKTTIQEKKKKERLKKDYFTKGVCMYSGIVQHRPKRATV